MTFDPLDVPSLTQLCSLKLRDTQLALRQLGADVVDLTDAVVVLEARKVSAVVARLEVDFGVIWATVGFLELVQHERHFGWG